MVFSSLAMLGLAAAGSSGKPTILATPAITQDFAKHCPAGESTNELSCVLPEMSAKDSNNNALSINKRIFLIDDGTNAMNMEVDKVDYSKRSTYLMKYDATDMDGKHAKQVVFSLFLDDHVPPVLKVDLCTSGHGPAWNQKNGNGVKVQAGSDWKICGKSSAIDAIDGDVDIDYSVQDIKTLKFLAMHKSLAEVQSVIDTSKLATYIVTVSAHDNAGLYGRFSKDNAIHRRVTLRVVDTTAPDVLIAGSLPTQQECKTTYTDMGATCKDMYDTEVLGLKLPAMKIQDSVASSKMGSYSVTYKCKDGHNNVNTATRDVNVVDTLKPTIQLIGDETLVWHMNTSAYHSHMVQTRNSLAFMDPEPGVICNDLCDSDMNGKDWKELSGKKRYGDFYSRWRGKQLNSKIPGTYRKKYYCKDSSGNTASAMRTIILQDKQAPEIYIKGAQSITLEASTKVEDTYKDEGATCTDYVDGNKQLPIMETKMFLGETEVKKIDVAVPGTYSVTYACSDKSGNRAEKPRVIHVQDTTCPVLTLQGKQAITLEAGNSYDDAGFNAVDSLDGDISSSVLKTGDTVDTSVAFWADRSCHEIKVQMDKARELDLPGVNNHDTPESGLYWITVKTTNSKATKTYKRIKAFCDMHSSNGYGYTYYPLRKQEQIVPYAGNDGGCTALGLHMAKFENAEQRLGAEFFYPSAFFAEAPSTSDRYLCSTNDHAEETLNDMTQMKHFQISDAEEGKYIIKYQVKDAAGNAQCGGPKYRTVLVKDTLVPVLTLHLAGSMVQHGRGGVSKITGKVNPAETSANPWFPMQSLMAETSSSSLGFAAVASAAMGLALLSFQARKRSAVSVPV